MTGAACDGVNFGAAKLYGATATVTLAANQQIAVAATSDFGGGDPTVPSGNLFLNVCYEPQGGALVFDENYFGPLSSAPGTLQAYSLTRSFSGLAAGTYTVGLCACVYNGNPSVNTNWNTDFSFADVRVFQQ
jgi:hypothetical protein